MAEATVGWVYIVEAVGQGLVKVGMTLGEPKDRLKQLQTGNPFRLDLLFAFLCLNPGYWEREIQAVFGKGREITDSEKMVGEWFRCSREEALDAMLHWLAAMVMQLGVMDFRSSRIERSEADPERFLIKP